VDDGELATLLDRHVSACSVPGAAVGILRDRTTTIAAQGVADVRTREPVSLETRFSAGSLTKSMVATVVARFELEGRLSLDDPASERVPELMGCEWAERATLRDLLANRSGLPLRSALEFGFDKRTSTDDGALSRLASDVAAADPSPGFWSYSNVGWCLLGRAIEAVTASTWEHAMRRHLADGAGMTETSFDAGIAVPLRAVGHEVGADGPVPAESFVARAYGPAGATATTTAADLLRFAALHLDDPALSSLRVVHAGVSIYGWLDAWCLGWARFDWDGGPVWGWDGLLSGERSFLRLLPDHRAAVVLMTNGGDGRALYRSLFPDLMDALFGIGVPPLRLEPSPGAAGDLSRFAGVYAWPDRTIDVVATPDGLVLRTEHGESEAHPIDGKTFLVDPHDPDNPTVTFGGFDAAGRPQVLYLMLWGLPRVRTGEAVCDRSAR
jgi:CubicO group peptidase (beta-lactamase class C family)